MNAAQRALTTEEFLAWERSQPDRYEFDGTQPVAMTGGTPAHAGIAAAVIAALFNRLRPPCRVFTGDLKVLTAGGRVRYPDVTVACGPVDADGDVIVPVVVFEVMSQSSTLTDRRVKLAEYGGTASIMAYVLLDQQRPEGSVFRHAGDWREERMQGAGAVLALPEIGVEMPLAAIYPG